MQRLIQFFKRNPFRREMLLVIIIKLLALFLLWTILTHPDKTMLEQPKLVEHYLESSKK